MKKVNYHCTHCGRRFEAEEREIIECPGCFWTTSVRKEEKGRKSESAPAAAARPDSQKAETEPSAEKTQIQISPAAVKLSAAFLILLVAVFLFYFFKVPDRLASIAPKKQIEIKAEGEQKTPSAGKPAPEVSLSAAGLSAEDGEVLARDATSALEQGVKTLSDEENAVLEKDSRLKTGIVERLPSRTWTVENFEAMIEEQEKVYKISFPRSYRKKLVKHFESTYLPASQAFESGQIPQARDGWVKSLAFPLYSEDLQKHRGVALTMLRPLINDVLAKIGVLNSLMNEKGVRGREEELNAKYESFRRAALDGNWSQADQLAAELERELSQYQQTAFSASGPPPYPPEIRQVDQDIVYTLMDLLKAPDPTVADVGGMLQDIRQKKGVIAAHNETGIEAQKKIYANALEKIKAGDYAGAGEELKKIQFPPMLVKDARDKIAVLSKLQHQTLDSMQDKS